MTKHVKWYTGQTIYVDEETGEELTKYQTTKRTNNKPDYIKVKTDKYYEFNYNKTIGTVKCTIRYRRNPQGRLEYGTDTKREN